MEICIRASNMISRHAQVSCRSYSSLITRSLTLVSGHPTRFFCTPSWLEKSGGIVITLFVCFSFVRLRTCFVSRLTRRMTLCEDVFSLVKPACVRMEPSHISAQPLILVPNYNFQSPTVVNEAGFLSKFQDMKFITR